MPAHDTVIRTENKRRTVVPMRYLGGADHEAISQVERIPPELVIIDKAAIEVARVTCGAKLFATHAPRAGDEQLIPMIVKNRLP